MDLLSDVLAVIRGAQPHAACTTAQAPWGVRFPAEDAAGCHVVLEGACWVIPSSGPPLALNAGDVVFIPPARGYALADQLDSPLVDFQPSPDVPVDRMRIDGAGPTTSMLCAAYYFDRDRGHPLLDDLPAVIRLPTRVGRHAALRSTIDLLGAELAEQLPGSTAILTSLVDMLLMLTLRAWFDDQSSRTTTGWATVFNDQSMIAALRGIHAQPERPWTVERLAALAGQSRATFAKRFAALVGRTPLAYLTWWRMTVAARLLREGDAPLRVVAARSGYASEFAFAKAFKRQFGQAPGRYRHEKPL